MFRLILLRHAKAAPHGTAPDMERALTKRGRRDSTEVGKILASEHLIPDLALVSPSLRTVETWDGVRPSLPPVTVRFEPGIYDAEVADLLDLVRATPDGIRTLLMVGHNPGFEDLARSLPGHGDRYAMARMRAKFPTAAFAVIDFPEDHWAGAGPGKGRLDRFVVPEGAGD
jgi:phosphohistidine phosphatase